MSRVPVQHHDKGPMEGEIPYNCDYLLKFTAPDKFFSMDQINFSTLVFITQLKVNTTKKCCITSTIFIDTYIYWSFVFI